MTPMLESSTPDSLGYSMPAEWEPHSDTWLAWPHNLETWNEYDLHEIEKVFIEIIRNLIDGERISILISDEVYKYKISTMLHREKVSTDSVRFHIIPTDDAWARDFGPNFLARETPIGRQIAVNRWRFNAWGEKYPWEKDNQAQREIVREVKLPWFDPGIVLEGGAIDVNGKGVCMTTTSCLLNPNRNGDISQKKIEGYLKDYIGAHKVIWINAGIEGDDTDGHIDNLARFINPTTIAYVSEEDKNDDNYSRLKSIPETLKNATDHDGKPFSLVALPMPVPIRHGATRLPASYANFYIGNRSVLVPSFHQKKDETAINILKPYFPRKKIIPIDSRILVQGQGGIHCITQQQPAHSPSEFHPFTPEEERA